MRNDPSDHVTQTNSGVGRGAVLTGYAAFAVSLAFLTALLFADHRHTMTAAAKDPSDPPINSFGIEELFDLLSAEPAVPTPGLFVWPKPRPVTRAELDSKRRR
jgi:hypothetical protein